MLRAVIHNVHEIAAEVIRKTGRDKPAEAALREVLKQHRELAPFDATEIAKTVFIYYRWHVWLREERGVESKMWLALRLDERFRANESNVPLADLRSPRPFLFIIAGTSGCAKSEVWNRRCGSRCGWTNGFARMNRTCRWPNCAPRPCQHGRRNPWR